MINNIKQSFVNHLENNNYSKNTINSYFFSISNLEKYLVGLNKSLNNFKENDINHYFLLIKELKAPQTINAELAAIKKFLVFLKKFHSINISCNMNPMKVFNKKSINKVNIEHLLNYLNLWKPTIIAKRNAVLFGMIYKIGARIKEILSIKKCDIANDKIILENKAILIDSELANDITNYLTEYNFKENDFIFFSYASARINFSKKLTEKSVEDIFNKYKKDNSLENLSLRDLKNSQTANIKSSFFEPQHKYCVKLELYSENYFEYVINKLSN
jgi:site-specific recombinase XerD